MTEPFADSWPVAVTTGVGRMLARYAADLAVEYAFLCHVHMGQVLRCLDQSGTVGPVPESYGPLIQRMQERGALVMVDDLAADSLSNDSAHLPLAGAFLGVGVFNEVGILIGVVLAHGLHARSWTNRDLERAGDMAQGVSSLLIVDELRVHAQQRVDAEAQARAMRLQMHTISTQSASASSLGELSRILIREIPTLVGADWAVVGVRYPETDWKAYLSAREQAAVGEYFAGADSLGDELFDHGAALDTTREQLELGSFPKLPDLRVAFGSSATMQVVAASLSASDSLEMVLVCGFSGDDLDLQTNYVFDEVLDDIRQVVARTSSAQRQIQAASDLQRSLLPPRIPDLPGFEIARLYNSAADHTRVGGDWYDIVKIDSSTTGFVVGDVAGHDIRSAAIMGQLRHVLASQLRDRRRPAGALAATDRYFADLAEDIMATAVVIVVDRSTEMAHIALAGHPPPVVLTADEARLVQARPGPPIGFGYGGYHDMALSLATGDTLVAYTDGVVERTTGDLAQHLDELVSSLQLVRGSVADLIQALDRHSRLSELVDDVAALVIRFTSEKPAISN